MGFGESVDNYCERLDASFWSEPLNAATNLAFIIASLLLLNSWRQANDRSAPALFLGLWIGVIGIGSFLFHTFATRWALLADSLPILVFILVYVYLAMRDYLGLAVWLSLTMVFVYVAAAAIVTPVLEPLVGSSSGYVTALIAMYVVAVIMLRREPQVGNGLLVTAGIFLVSIAFRMVDLPFCDTVTIGTHYVWHVLNAVVLYRLTRIYLDRQERIATATGSAAPDGSR